MDTFDPAEIKTVRPVGAPFVVGMATKASGITLGGVEFPFHAASGKDGAPTDRKYADIAVVLVTTKDRNAVIFVTGGDKTAEYGGETHRVYKFTVQPSGSYTNNGQNLADAVRTHLSLELHHAPVALIPVDGEDFVYAAVAPDPDSEDDEYLDR